MGFGSDTGAGWLVQLARAVDYLERARDGTIIRRLYGSTGWRGRVFARAMLRETERWIRDIENNRRRS